MKYLNAKTKNYKQKLFIVVLVLILIFIAVNFFSAWLKSSKVHQEINNLEQEISNLQKDTGKLTELIQYFNSNAYIEEKARVDLGLKKEGEKVVLVPDDIKKNLLNNENEEKSENELSNPKKWWNYFFK
jgi:cell division protein FtsL